MPHLANKISRVILENLSQFDRKPSRLREVLQLRRRLLTFIARSLEAPEKLLGFHSKANNLPRIIRIILLLFRELP